MLEKDLKTQILRKFKTYKELADLLGMPASNLSKQLKNPSPKFLIQLEETGIDLTALNNDRFAVQSFDNNKIHNSTNRGDAEMLNGNFNGKTINLKSNDAVTNVMQELIKNQREDVLFMRNQCIENQKKILQLLEELLKKRR